MRAHVVRVKFYMFSTLLDKIGREPDVTPQIVQQYCALSVFT